MASIITTDIIRYDHPSSRVATRSHILHPQSDITIIALFTTPKANVMSVIEDHFLESISSTEWNHGDEDTDFSYITERYNHFLSSLAHDDAEDIGVIFAVERGGHLMVSSIGDSEVILQEPGSSPVNIHEDTRGHHHFELISSGTIPVGGSVFIVSRSLENAVGDTFYSDCAYIQSEILAHMSREVLARDLAETTHLVRIQRSRDATIEKRSFSRENAILPKTITLLRSAWESIITLPYLQDIREKFRDVLDTRYAYVLTGFLIVGVILFFFLVSSIISAFFGSAEISTKDARNQIIEAKTLIDSSQKLTSNPVAFDATIKQAEGILSGLEGSNLFSQDTREQRARIEAMKKELYDIQTIDLNGRTSIVPFNPDEISPIGIFEREKKLNIIAKQGLIQGYAVGDTGIQIKKYPSGEQAKDFATLDDGNFYILTESDKILASRKGADIIYTNILGQEGWQKSDGIATFNGNIYLWNNTEGQIYRHRPSINGFGQKNPVLPSPSPGILDIGIDGGFYIIKSDGKIGRLVGTNSTLSGIILNNIPGDYTVGKNPSLTRIIIQSNLNYIYILDGNRVWLFSPDSKRFQDIRSWNYIAQMELSTKEQIRDIALPRDGLLYVVTDQGVYDILFEFVENNIILR